jgi:hypothetical protein
MLPVTPMVRLLAATFGRLVSREGSANFWLMLVICSLSLAVPVTTGNPPATPISLLILVISRLFFNQLYIVTIL